MHDPWSDLPIPRGVNFAGARRVDAAIKWDFFWARSANGRCMLLLRHKSAPAGLSVPKPRGLKVISFRDPLEDGSVFILELVDDNLKEVFLQLCLDIVSNVATAPTEDVAVRRTVERTWRWHYLLRGGAPDRLTPQEQIGLIGELHVLETVLLPVLGPDTAVSAWEGPLGAGQDFRYSSWAIEAKAYGPAGDGVRISSEHQLDSNGVSSLVLYTLRVAPGASADDGRTLAEIVNSLASRIAAASGPAAGRFASLLIAAGYDSLVDYSEQRWIVSVPEAFIVRPAFPALAPSNLPSGVSRVSYRLDLAACRSYLIDHHQLTSIVSGAVPCPTA